MTDFFAGIETAEGVRRLPDMLPGVGVVRITDIKIIQAQTGSDVFVIGEGEVVEHPENKPGDQVKVFMTNLRGKFPKSSLADVRMFLEAIKGGPVSKAESDDACQRNAFAGRTVRVQATREAGKKDASKTFTKYIYSPTGGVQAPATAPQAAPPPPPARAPIAPAFPPAGWTAHPDAPGYFYQGQDVKSEADLRAQAGA